MSGWMGTWRRRAALTAAMLGLLAACSPNAAAPPAAGQAASGLGGGFSAPPAVTQASTTAPSPADGAVVFTDPTEHAFTISAPAGWRVTGGVRRFSTVIVKPWAQAVSPDGAVAVFMGDASIPTFTLPSQEHPAGSAFDNIAGPQMAMDYQGGGDIAANYVRRAAPCAGLQPHGGQAEPDVTARARSQAEADKARTNSGVPVRTDFDGGSAVFSCQVDGKPYVIGAVAVTALTRFGQAGVWNVSSLFGYRAPEGRQAEADRVVRAMQASFQRDPAWQQTHDEAFRTLMAQIRQQGAQSRAAMQAQSQRDTAASLARGEAFAAAQAGRQADYMNQTNAQRDARNAAFAAQQDAKDVNHQRQMRYIQNRSCAVWWDAAHQHCRYTVDN